MESSHAGSSVRGRLAQNGVVIETSTVDYIHQLCLEALRAMASPLLRIIKDTNEDEDEDRLDLVTYEIQRLLQHPELFPSESARVKFLALMALDSELQFQEACVMLLIEAEIHELDSVRRHEYSRPLYQPGTRGWENFLLNMAPGAPEDPSNRAITTPKSAFQMVPAVGLRILADFEREEQDIVRYIDQAPANYRVEPAQTTLMIDFDKTTPWEERIPRRAVTQRTDRIMVRPNPFRAGRSIKDDISPRRTCEIEHISSFLHDIEAPRAAPGTLTSSNLFPAFSIRQWHPPTKYTELAMTPVD